MMKCLFYYYMFFADAMRCEPLKYLLHYFSCTSVDVDRQRKRKGQRPDPKFVPVPGTRFVRTNALRRAMDGRSQFCTGAKKDFRNDRKTAGTNSVIHISHFPESCRSGHRVPFIRKHPSFNSIDSTKRACDLAMNSSLTNNNIYRGNDSITFVSFSLARP